jgi:hypothetical protein
MHLERRTRMNHEMTIRKTETPSIDSRSRCAIGALLIALIVSLAACSTFEGSSEGTWNTSYFTNPDRVWGAIQLALIDLDYEVVSENRDDGIIRATSEPAEDGTVIELAIDQVMRTDDQVNVYVKPSVAGDQGSASPDLLRAAAEALIEALDEKLGG